VDQGVQTLTFAYNSLSVDKGKAAGECFTGSFKETFQQEMFDV